MFEKITHKIHSLNNMKYVQVQLMQSTRIHKEII